MRYPVKSNWINIEKIEGTDWYSVTDSIRNKTTLVSEKNTQFILQMDGKTDPLQILSEYPQDLVIEYVCSLICKGLLRYGRTVVASFPVFIRTLFIVNDRHIPTTERNIIRLINALSIFCMLPLCIMATCLGYNFFFSLLYYLLLPEYVGIGFLIGVALGMVIHEAAHALTAIAYNGRVYEFGIGISGVALYLYTMGDLPPNSKQLKILHFDLAGIVSNINIACLSLGIAIMTCRGADLEWSSVFLGMFLSNLCLALVNLCFFKQSDGLNAICHIVGIPNDIRFKDLPRFWKEQSPMKSISATIICIMRTLLPTFFVMYVLSMYLWSMFL